MCGSVHGLGFRQGSLGADLEMGNPCKAFICGMILGSTVREERKALLLLFIEEEETEA